MSQHALTPESRLLVRQRVVEHTARIFRRCGIKPVKMDDIAHDLQMSKRTIYQLFRDKEELLAACLENDKQQHDVMFRELLSDTNNRLEAILLFFKRRMMEIEATSPRYFHDLASYPQVLESFLRQREEMAERAIAFLNKGIDEGLFRKEINFDIVFRLIAQMSDNNIGEAYFKGRTPLSELYANTVIVYLRGCLTEAGLRVMEQIWGK